MKKFVLGFMVTMFFVGVSFAAPRTRAFRGQIFDSQCAMAGSHAMMVKKFMGANMNPNDPKVRAMCTKKCVSMGGKYVLYNLKTKRIYQLDNQTEPEQFAGENVIVRGTYNGSTKTIHVVSIKAAP